MIAGLGAQRAVTAIQSKCHCGAKILTIKQAPEYLAECNCTFCSQHGVIWAYYELDQVTLDQVDSTAIYSTRPDDHQHHFCRSCHCLSYNHQTRSWNEDGSRGEPGIGINVRLLERFDLEAFPIKQLDSLNQW